MLKEKDLVLYQVHSPTHKEPGRMVWREGEVKAIAPSVNGTLGAWVDSSGYLEWRRLEDLRCPF